MPNDKRQPSAFATPAARAAAALREIIEDPETPEVVRRTLVVSLQGLAIAVSQEIIRERGVEAPRRAVSEAQTLEHLTRWILYAEKHSIMPRPGTLVFTQAAG